MIVIATKLRAVALAIVLSVLLSGTAASQTVREDTAASRRGFWVGVVGGVNLVVNNTDGYPLTPGTGIVYNGGGTEGWGGLAGEYYFSHGDQNENSIAFQAIYDSRAVAFTQISTAGTLTTDLHLWSMNVSAKHNFWLRESPVGLGVMLGPSIGYQPQPRLTKYISWDHWDPNHLTILYRTYDTISEDAQDANKTRIALRVAFTGDIPMSKDLNAEIELGYDWPFTKVDRFSNWTTAATFGGISLRYFIGE